MAVRNRFHSCKEGFVGQCMRASTVHGMKFIGSRDLSPFERIFWSISLLGALVYSVILISQIFENYFKNPIIISYMPEESTVSQIPFPAVTLCNVNILKDKLVQESLRAYNETLLDLQEHLNDSAKRATFFDALTLLEHMAHYCLAAPSIRRRANLSMASFNGTKDFVGDLQREFVELIDAGRLSENFSTNGTKEYDGKLANFVNDATHDCDDMILKCVWGSKDIPCKSIFRPIMTQHGSCCVFNMMPRFLLRKLKQDSRLVQEEKELLDEEAIVAWGNFTDDMLYRKAGASDPFPKYPFYQRAGGKTNGLSILVNPELNTYSTCNANDGWGLKVVAHSPISFPRIVDLGKLVPHSSEVFVNIGPKVTTADKSIIKNFSVVGKNFARKDRGCNFHDEMKSKMTMYRYYTTANCMDECIAKYTFEKCGCVRYFMPRKLNQKLCGARKLNCSENAKKNVTTTGKTKFCDHCKPSCLSVSYKMHMTSFPIRKGARMHSIFYKSTPNETDMKKATNYSILHVFIGMDSFNALERKQLFTIWDAVGKIGGILGVTLGFSIICVVEVFSSFTFGAWRHFHSNIVEEGDDDEADHEMDSVVDYYASSRPRFSAIFRPKRVLENLREKEHTHSTDVDYKVKHVGISPFHLLKGKGY